MSSYTFLLLTLMVFQQQPQQLANAAPTSASYPSMDTNGQTDTGLSFALDGEVIPYKNLRTESPLVDAPIIPKLGGESLSAWREQSELDDSAIKRNVANETTPSDDHYTSAPSIPRRRPSTTPQPDEPGLRVQSSSPTAMPRKKIRRSTTTTSTTALPLITDFEMGTSSSYSSLDDTTEPTPSAASARPKTRKFRKKMPKKMESEFSQSILETESFTITSSEAAANSTISESTDRSNIHRGAAEDIVATTNSIMETIRKELLTQRPKTDSPTTTESQSVDEHDRGNPMAINSEPRITSTTTTTSTPTTGDPEQGEFFKMNTPAKVTEGNSATEPIRFLPTESPIETQATTTLTTPIDIQLVSTTTAATPDGSSSTTSSSTLTTSEATGKQQPQELEEGNSEIDFHFPEMISSNSDGRGGATGGGVESSTVTELSTHGEEEEIMRVADGQVKDEQQHLSEDKGLRVTPKEVDTDSPIREKQVEFGSTTTTTSKSSTNQPEEEDNSSVVGGIIRSTPSPLVINASNENVFVTHSPFEVSSAVESHNNDQRGERLLPATTVFEDTNNQSPITTTTEFISTQPEIKLTTTTAKQEPQQIFTSSEQTPGAMVTTEKDLEVVSSTTTRLLTTDTASAWEVEEYEEVKQQPPTTTTTTTVEPPSEPHVDGINVENVEESLTPIPADDVLVVEIEESSETADLQPLTTRTPTSTTETTRSSRFNPETEGTLAPKSTQQRPKINDELFYPIGSGGGGAPRPGSEEDASEEEQELLEERRGESDDLENRDETGDGRSNDNDGDFDLEAEIFPTIPALKNSLFESEILREKADMVEERQDLEPVTSTTTTTPATTTAAASFSTRTSTAWRTTTSTATPDDRLETFTHTGGASGGDLNTAEESADVSTVSHDSDTFFYISNTEVKVVEAVGDPSAQDNVKRRRGGYDNEDEKERVPQPSHKELSLFPENSVEEDVSVPLPDQNHSGRSVAAVELNEKLLDENIILSPAIATNKKNRHGEEEFDVVQFAIGDRPLRLMTDDAQREQEDEEEQGIYINMEQEERGEEQGSTSKNRLIEESAEKLSFVKVEETTDIFSSEEAFEFLNKPRVPVMRAKEDLVPEVIIEPYPQLLEADNDLPISIGVPIIGELPQQIKLSTSDEEQGALPGYHHFDIDNREVETMDGGEGAGAGMAQRTGVKEIKTVRKLKKSRGGKKQLQSKKRFDRDEQFADIIFENADNLLVKNPTISLEVPVLDFNFTILTSTSTMEPKLNFTNETTLLLEEEPIGINDLQTLFFTCFITLLLLLAVGSLAFVARFWWIKHYSYGTGLIGDNSTDPLASKSRTLSTEEFKSRDSGMSMFKSHDLEATTGTDQYGNGIAPATALLNHLNHHNSKNGDAVSEANGTIVVPYATGANGSIITMTLKNNHLIVETEERSDISRDARETKMHYSPSEKDGVFVVEVARGADTSYHSPRTGIAPQQPTFNGVDLLNTSNSSSAVANGCNIGIQEQQRVQVHHHPPPPSEGANGKLKSSTGLSQSDLSDSSSGSNKDYNYGRHGGAYTSDHPDAHRVMGAQIHLQQSHPHRPVGKQETIDLEPRLQSDIDLFNVETERREHCNGHSAMATIAENSNNGRVMPDILVKSSAAPAAIPVVASIDQSVES